MEDTHFDAMVKALGSLTTRRLTLGALMGGELGRLGLADVGAKKSGKCKPKCDECEKCHKGSCKTKNGKKRCHRGKCKSTCGSTQVCQSGSCFPRGTCPATATTFCPIGSGTACGSPACFCGQSTEGNIVCVSLAGSICPPSVPAGTATPCASSATCPSGSACINTSGCCGPGIRVCLPQCPTPDA